jgi:hypothetical protein
LREEGDEEDGRLRVQDVDDHALPEQTRVGPTRWCSRLQVVGLDQVPYSQQDEIRGPAYFTSENAIAEDAKTAEAPAAAAATCTSDPVWIPSVEAIPARLP